VYTGCFAVANDCRIAVSLRGTKKRYFAESKVFLTKSYRGSPLINCVKTRVSDIANKNGSRQHSRHFG